jgi:hypothetical protein
MASSQSAISEVEPADVTGEYDAAAGGGGGSGAGKPPTKASAVAGASARTLTLTPERPAPPTGDRPSAAKQQRCDSGARPSAGAISVVYAGGGGRVGMYSGRPYKLADAETFLDDPVMWGLTAFMEASGGAAGDDGAWGLPPREEDEDDFAESGEGDSGLSSSGGLPAAPPTKQRSTPLPRSSSSLKRTPQRQSGSGNAGGDLGAAGCGTGPGGTSRGGGVGGGGGGGGGEGAGGVGKGKGSCFGTCGERHGGTAPLWVILRKAEYGKRARALFRHMWGELGRAGGPEQLPHMEPFLKVKPRRQLQH